MTMWVEVLKLSLKELALKLTIQFRVVIVETSKDHIFAVEELMMPILAIVRV